MGIRRLRGRAVVIAAVIVALAAAAPVAGAAPLFTAGELGHATNVHNPEFTGTAMLADGSAIVVGSYGADGTPGTIDLVGGAPLPATALNTDNAFVAKRSATGAFLWQTAIVPSAGGFVWAMDVATTADGSAIVVGAFRGAATFGSIGIANAGVSNGVLYVAKLRADGSDFAWVRTATGPGQSEATSVAVLADGSVVIGGDLYGTIGIGGRTVTSAGGSDLLAARLPADGSGFSWVLRGGGTGSEVAAGGDASGDGSALIAGYCDGTAVFGQSALDCTGGGYDHPLVAKAKADGSGWAWALAPVVGDNAYAADAAPRSDGGAMVVGDFTTSAAFGSTALLDPDGQGDAFVAMTRADGTGFASAAQASGTAFSTFQAIAPRPDGSAVLSGYYLHSASGVVLGGTGLNGAAATSTMIVTIDGPGAITGAAGAGTTGDWWAYGAAALPDGSAVVTGGVQNAGGIAATATFGASSLTTTLSGSNRDFLAAGALVAPVTPAAPTATAGAASATVGVTPLVGPSITRYTVTASPGGRTCTIAPPAASCTVTGLANGTAHTFTAVAENAAGTSAASAASSSVTPAKAKSQAPRLTRAPTLTRSGSAVYLVSSVRVGAAGTLAQRATYAVTARAARASTACTAQVKAKKAGTVTITCKLNAKARIALRKGALRLTLTTTFTETGKLTASTTRRVTVPRTAPSAKASHGVLG